MVMEANPKDFYDESGVLTMNYYIDKTGKRLPVTAPATDVPAGDGE